MAKPTLHVVSLPHTTLTEKNITCAYSMKVLKFTKMMRAQGYPVILYGPDVTDAEADEHVTITTRIDRIAWGFEDGFDTVKTPFEWHSGLDYWATPNRRAIRAIKERAGKHDILCLIAGWAQQPIAEALPMMAVEWGVGYEGVFANYAAFESYAWQHYLYGKWEMNGRAFDAVIPNFFDLKDFKHPSVWQGAPKADYVLFIGRFIFNKGPTIAAEIAKKLDIPLLIAGQGAEVKGKKIVGDGFEIDYPGAEYLGPVGFEERANLMGRARAVIVPTLYNEPFGGVSVEAMLAGTPVVASDWGSFSEIVRPETGRLFRTPLQGARAVEEVASLDPITIREHAASRFSLEAVGPQFDRWFESLGTLWDEGYYT